jgi:hypothetical protein
MKNGPGRHTQRGRIAELLARGEWYRLLTTYHHRVFAILLEHRPHPGPAAIWLFVAGAALGFSVVVRASGAHRSASTLPSASGYQLFNLCPVAVVRAVSLIVWWIPLGSVAYALGGLSASSGYLLAVAWLSTRFRARDGKSVPVLKQGHARIKRNQIGHFG